MTEPRLAAVLRDVSSTEFQSVAVDRAGLAMDPVGADTSVLIGSGLSWSLDEGLMIGENEPSIYDAYVSGLLDAGWTGDLRDVKRGFFTHFPLYLGIRPLIAEGVRAGTANNRRAFIETRFGMTLEEVSARMAPLVALIPRYVDELRQIAQVVTMFPGS